MNITNLQKRELFDIIKLGYWPVEILAEQKHWLANGEPLDDSSGPIFDPDSEAICGYEFHWLILETISIHLSIYQGNVVDIDGDSTLVFSCHNLDTGSAISEKEFKITGFDQLESALATWQHFIKDAWPEVNRIIKEYANSLSKKTDRNTLIYADMVKLAWKHFNLQLQDDVIQINGYQDNWSALDAIEEWMKQ